MLVAIATWQLSSGQDLLRNPSFEEELVSDDWISKSFTMERTQLDTLNGSYALNCSQR